MGGKGEEFWGACIKDQGWGVEMAVVGVGSGGGKMETTVLEQQLKKCYLGKKLMKQKKKF